MSVMPSKTRAPLSINHKCNKSSIGDRQLKSNAPTSSAAVSSLVGTINMRKVHKGNLENLKCSVKTKPKVVKHDCGASHKQSEPYQSKQLPLTLKERWIDAGPRFEARRMYQQNLHGQRPPWATDEDLTSDCKHNLMSMSNNDEDLNSSCTMKIGEKQRILRILTTRKLYKTPGTRSQATSSYVDHFLKEMTLADEFLGECSNSRDLRFTHEMLMKSQSVPNLFADSSHLIQRTISLQQQKKPCNVENSTAAAVETNDDVLSEDSLSEHEFPVNPANKEVSKTSKSRAWALQHGDGDSTIVSFFTSPTTSSHATISINSLHERFSSITSSNQSNLKSRAQSSRDLSDRKPFYPPGVYKHQTDAEQTRKNVRQLVNASSVECLPSRKNTCKTALQSIYPQKQHKLTQQATKSMSNSEVTSPSCVKMAAHESVYTHANLLNDMDYKLFDKKRNKERSVSDIDLDVIFNTTSHLPCAAADEINNHISYWLKKNIYFQSNDSINMFHRSEDDLSGRLSVDQKPRFACAQNRGNEGVQTFLSQKHFEISAAATELEEDSLTTADGNASDKLNNERTNDHVDQFEMLPQPCSNKMSQLNVHLVTNTCKLKNEAFRVNKDHFQCDSEHNDVGENFGDDHNCEGQLQATNNMKNEEQILLQKHEEASVSSHVEDNRSTNFQSSMESKTSNLRDIFSLSDNSCLTKISNADESHSNQSTNGGSTTLGRSNDACFACLKRVYQIDKFTLDDKIYHKSCFRCSKCNCLLKILTYASHENALYCKPHYSKLFLMSVQDHVGKKFGISHENDIKIKSNVFHDLNWQIPFLPEKENTCETSLLNANHFFYDVDAKSLENNYKKEYCTQVENIKENCFHVSNAKAEANSDKQLRPAVTSSICNERLATNFYNAMEESTPTTTTTLIDFDAVSTEESDNTIITETVENRLHEDEEINEEVDDQFQLNSCDVERRVDAAEEHAKSSALQKSLSQDQSVKLPIDISKESARDTELAENNPQIRTDVFRETDNIEVLPEPGTAKNVLNLWRTKENAKENANKEHRTFKHRTSLDGNAHGQPLNKDGKPIEVVRETDGPAVDEMPQPNSASERLALFRQMEAINGKTVPAVPSPLSAAKLAAKAREASGVNRNFFLPASQLPPPSSSIESEQSEPRKCSDETIENSPIELPADVIRYGASSVEDEEIQIGITRNLRARFQQDS